MLGKARSKSELDATVFDAVIETGSVADRCQLAEELARFTCDADTPPAERDAVVLHLLQLAADPVEDVRRRLAEGLHGAQLLDADVVFTIVASEDEIALPFLAATPALDSWR